MTNVEDLMRLVDSLADAAFATGQAQAGIRPVCVLPDTKHLRRRIEHALIPLCTELEVLRDAVEAAYDFITAMSSDPDCDDDGTQGAIRATRRKMAEALGNALPRLLYEKREGQKLFGLRCRELAEENAHLRDALVKAEENLRRPLPSRPDFRASWNPPSNYSDAYDWHQYLDKPEEKASQPVNGPGTAVDSRSAASMSSLVPNSQPSGIVSSGVSPPSRATHTDTIIGLCNKCGGQVADACDVIGHRRPAPTCLHCGAMAPQPTQVRRSMFGPLVMMGEPPVDEVWAEDFWRKGKP